ncbi:MAG: hydantoinase B/oxoprolinase family protein, partial [Nitrospinota bacterium]
MPTPLHQEEKMEAKAKRKRKAERTKIDPTTFTVILNAFQTITREMTLAFEYTAWTTIISDARDFSCAIYDAQARQVAMLDAIPIHTNSMSIVINEIARTFEGDIHEGDLIICNDPYSGNTHVGDLVMACPVFHKKQHLFWTVTKAHHLDSGAPIPSSMPQTATDVWTEGLTIPPFKIYDKGVERKDAIRLILAHWRWPWATGGDLRAQMGTVWLGRKRLLELIESYGVETIKRYVEEMIDYADRMTAAEIRDFPDGTYVGYTWIDSDGQGRTDIPIKATVTIKDDMVHVDFTGSSPQTPGAVNASYAVMRAAAGIPVLTCVDSAIPHNEGCIKHIVGTAPKGTVATAEWPYSTALCTICCGDALQEAVMRALAHAVPELRSAGIGRIVVPAMSGEDRRGEQPTLYGVQLFNAGPGGGASKGYDGWPVINDAAVMGGLKLIAIELCELLYPLLFEHYEMETDSAGAGQWRGAPGVRMSIRPVGGPME